MSCEHATTFSVARVFMRIIRGEILERVGFVSRLPCISLMNVAGKDLSDMERSSRHLSLLVFFTSSFS